MKRARSPRLFRNIACLGGLWIAGLTLGACGDSSGNNFFESTRRLVLGSDRADSPAPAAASTNVAGGTSATSVTAAAGPAPTQTAGAPGSRKPPGAPVSRGSTPARTKAATPSRPSRATSGGGGGRSTPSATPPPERPYNGRVNGAKCSDDDECAARVCNSGVCGSDYYSKKFGRGVACSSDSDCESDNCYSHVCRSASDPMDSRAGKGVACKYDSDCLSDYCSSNICN